MTEKIEDLLPSRSLPELQIAIARIAFRIAQLSRIIERDIGPKGLGNLADPDPRELAKEARAIQDDMIDLSQELIGDD